MNAPRHSFEPGPGSLRSLPASPRSLQASPRSLPASPFGTVHLLASAALLTPAATLLTPAVALSGQSSEVVRTASVAGPRHDSAAANRSTPDRPPLDIRVSPQGFLHRIVLSDGRVYYGRIVSRGDPVRVGLALGGVEDVPRSRIVRIEKVRGEMVDGDFWPQDPNHSRLIFAPTGRNLPRGSGSLNAYYGVMPFLAVGITDRITLAGGTSIVKGGSFALFPSSTSLVPSDEAVASRGRIVHVAPKVQVLRTRRLETAVGALLFLRTSDPAAPTGVGYAVATWAPDDRTGLTGAAGLGLIQGRWEATPTWMVGADRRVSRRVKLLTENYHFPGGGTVHMAGIRVLGEQISGDLGLAAHAGSDSRRVFPVLNVSVGW